jgi:DNA-binding CsgD family transcriptional regulator
MNDNYNELNNLVQVMSDNKLSYTVDFNTAFEALKDKADRSDKICQIVDFEKYAQVYFNPVAVEYFGVTNEELHKMGFAFVFKYLHPENFSVVKTHIAYFSNPENYDKVLSHLYYVNTSNGWRWLYNCTRVVTFTAQGKAKYLFVSGTDITNILEGKDRFRKLKNNLGFVEQNGVLFQQLTGREKEILRLIVDEKTSQEIAAILQISAATVDTHRNNILQKLQVKSSVGLVKYAIMFDLIKPMIFTSHE